MKYLLVSIINTVYGILLLMSLSDNTVGYFIVFSIGIILTTLGVAGFALWLRHMIISVKKETPDDETLKSWFGIVKAFDIVLILGLFFRIFIFQPFVVDGNSMEPNFHDKEALLVDKITYKFRSPQRGEVIIFKAPPNPQADYIKRIVGLPGETIIIENGQVYINDHLLRESYLNQDVQTIIDSDSTGVLRKTLQSDEYFVMGDNRLHSSDSREWGILPKVNLIGRASIVVWPFKIAGYVRTPSLNSP